MKLYYPREPDVFRLKGSYLESRFGFLIATFVVAACFFSIFASSWTWANHQFRQKLCPYLFGTVFQTDGIRSLSHPFARIHKTYILYWPYLIEIMVFWGWTLKSNISMSECSSEHFRLITSVLDFGKGQWLARCQRVGRRFHAIMPLLRVVGNKPMTNRKLMTNPWDTFFRGPKPSDRKIGIGPKMSLSNAWPYWLICQTNSGWIPNVILSTEFRRWTSTRAMWTASVSKLS